MTCTPAACSRSAYAIPSSRSGSYSAVITIAGDRVRVLVALTVPGCPLRAEIERRVTEALKRLLRQHEPFPAVVMDRYWNVVLTNAAAPRFFGSFVDLAARPTPRNLLHLMFDPEGMRPFIVNWDDVARSLIQRVYREAVGRVVDEKCQELMNSLLAYPGAKSQWRAELGADGTSDLPVIPITFVKDGQKLGYFSMLTTVAAPHTVATQELRLESMFPVDEETEERHIQMMEQQGSSLSH